MDYIFVTLLIIVCYFLYINFFKYLYYFQKLDVPYVSGWPVLGNMADVIFRRKHLTQITQDIYNLNPDAKYVGFFDFTEPVFMLRDLELIKDVAIKNFDNFPDHKPIGVADLDELMGGNIFNLNGHKWKEMRSTLTPSFTASKMKMMFPLMVECAENVVKYIGEQSDNFRKMISSKDLFTRYTSDVLATCSFGFVVDSLKNPNNEFYVHGKRAINMEGILAVKMLFSRTFPNMARFFNIKLFNEEVTTYFSKLVQDTVEMRDEKGITRPDMLQLLMEARKTSNMNINQITAQAFAFFFAGFDTTSSTICMIAQELAIHHDIQKRLQDEIDEVMKQCNGQPTYEAIYAMPYLDAVFNEVNRLHGQGFMLDRLCRIAYELPPVLPGKKPIKLKPGMRIIIPSYAIHRDPNYYENPNEFIPDRYYEKKITINDVLNLSFGIGPRGCIGNRFAILETKILLVHLLAKFNFKPNEKTCNPTRYSKKTASMQVDGGFWLSIEPRMINSNHL